MSISPLSLTSLLCACLVAACSEPDVTGRILTPSSSGAFQPAANVEVLLVKGNMRTLLDGFARQYDDEITAEASNSTLEKLKFQLAGLATEIDLLDASLRDLGEKQGSVGCLSDALRAADDARVQYAALFSRLRPDLQALEIDADDTNTVVRQIEAKLSEKLDAEARRLGDEYLHNQVAVQSSVVLNGSARIPDRLCWTISNKGRLKLISVDLDITYKDRRVPAPLVRSYWATPFNIRGVLLTVRDQYGQEVRGLPPGGVFSECFHAVSPDFTIEQRNTAEELGLPHTSASRSGSWQVVVDTGVLTDSEAIAVDAPGAMTAHLEYPVRRLAEVMAPELRSKRELWPHTRLLGALKDSKEARNVKVTEKVLSTCRRADELHMQKTDLTQAIAALERGETKDPAAISAIRQVVHELKQNAKRRSALVSKGSRNIEHALATFQRTAANGAFAFTDVEKGDYTLVATSDIKDKGSLTWIVPIAVTSDVQQELGKSNAMEGTLSEAIDKIILNEPDRNGR